MTPTNKLDERQMMTRLYSFGENVVFPDSGIRKPMPMTLQEKYEGVANVFYCENCGKLVIKSKSDESSRFCSWKCLKEHNQKLRVEWKCERCGKEMKTAPSKKRRFCSRKCFIRN